eukprot:scaffold225907_cov32-Tisochrysis_lutea.AAC.1
MVVPSCVLRLAAAAAVVAFVTSYWRRRIRGSKVTRSWSHGVEVRPSRIPNSGDGLFATRHFAQGELLGEYHGRVLSLYQATQLENRDYLMGGFGINSHVDARFALTSPARYVNDHFDPAMRNAHFVKDKARKRAQLVASRPILQGEEIYASYGESYWRARGIEYETGHSNKS